MSNVEALQSKCTAYSISEFKIKLQKSSVNLSPLTFAALFPFNPTSQRSPPPATWTNTPHAPELTFPFQALGWKEAKKQKIQLLNSTKKVTKKIKVALKKN